MYPPHLKICLVFIFSFFYFHRAMYDCMNIVFFFFTFLFYFVNKAVFPTGYPSRTSIRGIVSSKQRKTVLYGTDGSYVSRIRWLSRRD